MFSSRRICPRAGQKQHRAATRQVPRAPVPRESATTRRGTIHGRNAAKSATVDCGKSAPPRGVSPARVWRFPDPPRAPRHVYARVSLTKTPDPQIDIFQIGLELFVKATQTRKHVAA